MPPTMLRHYIMGPYIRVGPVPQGRGGDGQSLLFRGQDARSPCHFWVAMHSTTRGELGGGGRGRSTRLRAPMCVGHILGWSRGVVPHTFPRVTPTIPNPQSTPPTLGKDTSYRTRDGPRSGGNEDRSRQGKTLTSFAALAPAVVSWQPFPRSSYLAWCGVVPSMVWGST